MVIAAAIFLVASATASSIKEFTCGHLFYRTLYLDKENDNLYVGAMDKLFKIDDLGDISKTDCDKNSMDFKPTRIANCIARGKSVAYDCRNHIRVIAPIGDGRRLYICGTNAHNPRDDVIYANMTSLGRHEFYPGIGDAVAKCPFDPEDNSTALWVSSGNPGGHPAIYSGTNAEFTQADPIVFRSDIFDAKTGRREFAFKRTIKYDSHMLDKPDFVGTFDVGNYVYIFFREKAVEYMNCGTAVYSRVARVCKSDMGGKIILDQNWATFLKARINCSIPGEFPFFFDEIQDVWRERDRFHAVFTTSQNGLGGSAVCSFRLEDIDNIFDKGKFKEQATSTSMWLPVPSSVVPEPRPGSCVPDTRDLPDTVLNFIRKHPLMDGDVAHDSNMPAFYIKDVVFRKVVVDQRKVKGSQYTIFYIGTNDGKIFKVARWNTGRGGFESRLLDIVQVFPQFEPVRAIALSQRSKILVATSDNSVRTISTYGSCNERYRSCARCVRDPYCGWNPERGHCSHAGPYTIQDPQGLVKGICEASLSIQKVTANFGSSIHLSCGVDPESADKNRQTFNGFQPVSWHFYGPNQGSGLDLNVASVSKASEHKHVFTQDNGLVVIGVRDVDAGRYECRLGRETLISYDVSVDVQRCSAPNKTADYQKIYSDWCHEFQKYKSALDTWEKNRNKCGGGPPPSPNNQHENSVYTL